MARAGRKRKLKPREPSGRIKKTARDPVVWTRPPEEQISKREAILHSRTATGEISEPFTHIRPLLSDEQIAAAERFQRHWARSKVPGGPADPKCIFGDLQPLGAIPSAYGHDESEAFYRKAYSDARLSMSPKCRYTVELLTGKQRPMYNSQGCPIAWFQLYINRHMTSYKLGLNQLSKHYGFDKVAKSGVWVAE